MKINGQYQRGGREHNIKHGQDGRIWNGAISSNGINKLMGASKKWKMKIFGEQKSEKYLAWRENESDESGSAAAAQLVARRHRWRRRCAGSYWHAG